MAKNYTPVDHLISPSPASKEIEPSTRRPEQSDVHEFVEHEPHKEVQSFIESHPETIKLTDDQKNLGAQEIPPTKFSVEKPLVPLTEAKIQEGLKMPVESSFRWLAEWCRNILWHAGRIIKVKK